MKITRYFIIVLGIMCVLTLGCEKMQKPMMDAMTGTDTDTGMGMTGTDTDTGMTDTDTGMTGTDTDTGMEVDPDAIRPDDIIGSTNLNRTIFESYEDAIASAEVQEKLTAVKDFLRENCGTDTFYLRGDLLHSIIFTHRDDRDKFIDYLADNYGPIELWYTRLVVQRVEEVNYFRIAYSPDDNVLSDPRCTEIIN